MAHYAIINVTPTSEDWIPAYIEAVGPLLAKHGGKFLARTASNERVQGTGSVRSQTTRLCRPAI